MVLKEVKELVRSSQFRYVRVLDAKGKDSIAVFSGSSRNPEPEPEAVCQWLDLFFESHPGVYTLECKRSYTVSQGNKFVYANVMASVAAQGQAVAPVHVNEADIVKRITAQLMADAKEKEKIKAMADLMKEAQRKSDELDTAAGKLIHLGTKILNVILKNNPAIMGMLQGPPEAVTMNTQPIDIHSMSAEDQQKANLALSLFLKHMHPDLLLKFAEKINSNPGFITSLQTFL